MQKAGSLTVMGITGEDLERPSTRDGGSGGRSKEGLPSDCQLYKKQGVDRRMVKQLDVTIEATVVKSPSITAQIAIITRKREMTTA